MAIEAIIQKDNMKICKKILKKIVEEYNFELGKDPIKSIYDNADKVDWLNISYHQKLLKFYFYLHIW
jgi:hypothetical protein